MPRKPRVPRYLDPTLSVSAQVRAIGRLLVGSVLPGYSARGEALLAQAEQVAEMERILRRAVQLRRARLRSTGSREV